MANVKCKCCGKSVDKNIAIKEEYITNSLTIANRYFCSMECKDKFHQEEKIKSDFYLKCSEIIGTDISRNVYFKKCMKDIDKSILYIYVDKYFDKLFENFRYEIKKIEKTKTINLNYKIAVLSGMISSGIKVYVDEKISDNFKQEKEILVDYIDYESLMPKGVQVKQRKTIFDEE